jgi:hypothetical protein
MLWGCAWRSASLRLDLSEVIRPASNNYFRRSGNWAPAPELCSEDTFVSLPFFKVAGEENNLTKNEEVQREVTRTHRAFL